MSREHLQVVSDLYHLIDELLAFDLQLRLASGQYPKAAEMEKAKVALSRTMAARKSGKRAAKSIAVDEAVVRQRLTGIDYWTRAQVISRLDKKRMAGALASFKGSEYPAHLVKLLETYRKEAVVPQAADACSFLFATLAYQVVRPRPAHDPTETPPRLLPPERLAALAVQQSVEAAHRFGSPATVRGVEKALAFGRRDTPEGLVAGRVYTALAFGSSAAIQGDLFVEEPKAPTRPRTNARAEKWKPRTMLRDPLKALLSAARPTDDSTTKTAARGVLRSVVGHTWPTTDTSQQRASTLPKRSARKSTRSLSR